MRMNQDNAPADRAAKEKRRDCRIVTGLATVLLAAWIGILVGMLQHIVTGIGAAPSTDEHSVALQRGATEQRNAVR